MPTQPSHRPILGDLLFTRGELCLNKITAWATEEAGEAQTLATHQGIFKNRNHVVEALADGVAARKWAQRRKQLKEENAEWAIFGLRETMPKHTKAALRHQIEKTEGTKYAFLELGLCLLDGLVGKAIGKNVIYFRKAGRWVPGNAICSKASNLPFIAVGLFPKEAEFWTPDCTYDFLLNSDEWELKANTESWYMVKEKLA